MKDCLFCRISDGELETNERPENTVLTRTENFYVKPALGAFVEGYCLIVANDHYRTMAELGEKELDELEDLARNIRARLTLMYGTAVSIFEHGAVCPAIAAGACIDHAHMHILPVACDVGNHLAHLKARKLAKLRDLHELSREGQSYILWAKSTAITQVFLCEDRIPSQFMRRAICEEMGSPELWDWRRHPFQDKIRHFSAKWRETEHSNEVELADSSLTILS